MIENHDPPMSLRAMLAAFRSGQRWVGCRWTGPQQATAATGRSLNAARRELASKSDGKTDGCYDLLTREIAWTTSTYPLEWERVRGYDAVISAEDLRGLTMGELIILGRALAQEGRRLGWGRL